MHQDGSRFGGTWGDRQVIKRKAGRQPRVLLVDDDIELMNLCAAVLKTSGASVLTAASPAEALSIMAQPAVNDVGVDVAVLDYRLPGMNGRVLADCLRVRHPELKIILYSGEFDIPQAEMGGIDAFVPKCSGVEPLLAEVWELTDILTIFGKC